MAVSLIKKLEKAGLVGRGGAAFPTHLKWKFTKQTKDSPKYVVCNASEGEPGIFKDIYLLKNHLEEVMLGMKLAMDYLKTKEGYLNINKVYYANIKKKLDHLIRSYRAKGYRFHVYKEEPSYIGGEESALLNAIEGKKTQPRIKPPYSSEKGLFEKPTIVHNVETLYDIACVANNKYEKKRFCCISGPVKNPGPYHLDRDITVEQALKETDNLPDYPFFVQIGGSVSGPVYNQKQIGKQKLTGAGSIEVYKTSTPANKVLFKWFSFYNEESCGKCTPCREGTYQLYHLLRGNKKIPWDKVMDIAEALEETSFCALGASLVTPIKTYYKNILKK